MLAEMLPRHLVTLFLVLLFGFRLRSGKSFHNTETRYFWLTLISCLLLMIEDALEQIASQDPSLCFWRILLSVMGYTLRSTAAVGLLLVILSPERRNFLVWIPALITLLTSCTAFFTDLAFSFTEDYQFMRGPLGYVVYAVPILYLLLILRITLRRFTENTDTGKYIAVACGVFCLCAAVSDSVYGGIRLNEALMISSIFFYIILYSHDNRRDALTGLLNRQAFYDDCASFSKSIRAAASLDMNGLKELNDAKGHQAGDEALSRIGACMTAATDRNALAYRIGGDEFVILFFHANEEKIIQVEKQIIESVTREGYSVSAGYAIREKNQKLEETVKISDGRMYEDKANYYRVNGRDRRRRAPVPHE